MSDEVERAADTDLTDNATTAVPDGPDVNSNPQVEAAQSVRVMVDPRGQRFSAAISVVVMAVALIVGLTEDLAAILLTVQGFAFGIGAMFGLRFQPYGWLYRVAVRPRLGAPKEYEDEAPPRFAQLVGFVFILIAVGAMAFEVTAVAYVAVAFALAAAFLNAAFGFCLGCQMYLTYRRITARKS